MVRMNHVIASTLAEQNGVLMILSSVVDKVGLEVNLSSLVVFLKAVWCHQ